ncbi:MAG: polysulfide reductase NrfD [Candidatus Sericytochromatia bacterium]|nr:polysulfide reductase NrfD [Candidatus Tanganyikabacteria bacterium]
MKEFIVRSVRAAFTGGPVYKAWLAILLLLGIWGFTGWVDQMRGGLILTNMRDQVSWAFYIGNFTFLVGVAAAAVIVVIPAYIYRWGPIKEVCILGEILAISAIIMCFGFVSVDVGRPDRIWHLIPFVGRLNWPNSVMAWDVLVLNIYFLINFVLVSYMLWCAYHKRHYNEKWVIPLIILSIPAAFSIHTVTAFIYAGYPGRPFWNAGILAPRFIASALCSGPAIMIILFQILQRTTKFDIKDEAIHKIAELMAYTMCLNLFLLGAEVFKEFYSATEHVAHAEYLFLGLHGHNALVFYAWASVAFSVVATVLFLVPATRRNFFTLNLGCLLIYLGVYIEKGMGLVMPGFTPTTMGEIYEYVPTLHEIRVGVMVFSLGFLVYTLLTKVAVEILTGALTADSAKAGASPRIAPHEGAAPSGA